MDDAALRAQLLAVFRDVFDDASLTLRDEMTASDVEGWDSLTHVNLIVAAERAFAVSFTTREVRALANVGDFAALIRRKLR